MEGIEPTTESPSAPAVESPCTVPPTGLTLRQREFVRLYLLKGSAYAAFLKAFDCKTEKEITKARTYAYRLLKTAEVRETIKANTESARKRLRVESHNLVKEISAIAHARIGDYYEFDTDGHPKLKPGRDIGELAQIAIQSIEQTVTKTKTTNPDGTVVENESTRTKLSLFDKVRAHQMLWKHLGLDKPVNPFEAFLDLLPLEIQRVAAESLRVAFSNRQMALPPAPAPASTNGSANGYHPTTGAESN